MAPEWQTCRELFLWNGRSDLQFKLCVPQRGFGLETKPAGSFTFIRSRPLVRVTRLAVKGVDIVRGVDLCKLIVRGIFVSGGVSAQSHLGVDAISFVAVCFGWYRNA